MKRENRLEFFEKSYNFLKLVGTELRKSREIYGIEDSKTLRRYYSGWLKGKEYFSYVIYYTALRHMHLLKYINNNVRILDAGCGTGTEGILFGINGADVLGIDISDTRLRLAQKRKNYYEKIFDVNLKVKFKLDNVFNVSGLFDIIWVNEAISHIHPFEAFLRLCFNRLKDGGKLIIADCNKLNPIFFYKAKEEQKKSGGVIITKKDPKTGDDIPYAVERIFTIYQIKLLLSKLFKDIKIYPIGYIPFFLYNRFPKETRKFEEFLQYFPIIKDFSRSYIASSTK